MNSREKGTRFCDEPKLYHELIPLDVSIYSERYVFALKTQQFYTAIEDFFKQIAESFENHITNHDSFHKELLKRMNIEIPNIRPAVISSKSFLVLDKLNDFCNFISHAYDCELDPEELLLIQNRLKNEFGSVKADLDTFREYLIQLTR